MGPRMTIQDQPPRKHEEGMQSCAVLTAPFRRNAGERTNHYTQAIMTYVVDIDARVARHGLHAGRLHAGD